MSLEGWRVDDRDDLRLVRCEAFERISELAHAFSTRQGNGTDRFDLGSHEDVDAKIQGRRRRFCEAAGLGQQRPTILNQVHGARVLHVQDVILESSTCEADGVVATRDTSGTAAGEAVLAVRWADCVPVLLAEHAGAAVAAVHAGWRGIVAGVVPAAVRRLGERGIRPADLCAAVGPAIGGCCYQVGNEVIAAVSRASGLDLETLGAQAGRLDLRRAVGLQLEREGLERNAIHIAPWCTYCRGDLFFSYRREGTEAGRQMACIGWRRAARPPESVP